MKVNTKKVLKAMSLINNTISILKIDGINSKKEARDMLQHAHNILDTAFHQNEGYVIIEDDKDINSSYLGLTEDCKIEWTPVLEDAVRFESRNNACHFLQKNDFQGICKVVYVSKNGLFFNKEL